MFGLLPKVLRPAITTDVPPRDVDAAILLVCETMPMLLFTSGEMWHAPPFALKVLSTAAAGEMEQQHRNAGKRNSTIFLNSFLPAVFTLSAALAAGIVVVSTDCSIVLGLINSLIQNNQGRWVEKVKRGQKQSSDNEKQLKTVLKL